ncbi:MAG: hypothetical protein JWP63_935, partial [Candidatus Solibacter sp.]|nr:hypothetical protein [Candidatus Solibacter sp.]
MPSYSASSIVNASNFTPGPFAPNSVISIFGAGLARSTHALADSDLVRCATSPGFCLPLEMNFVRVYVQDQPAAMLFVSDGQINFVMPGIQLPGVVRVRVVVEGLSGSEIPVTLADAAPALFPLPNAYVIATSADNKLLTSDAPAHANDYIVVYCTGLGQTDPNPALAVIPSAAAPMTAIAGLKVSLNGVTLDAVRIKYAGITPGSAGLYQINLVLPDGTGPDPEIRVWSGSQTPQTGL